MEAVHLQKNTGNAFLQKSKGRRSLLLLPIEPRCIILAAFVLSTVQCSLIFLTVRQDRKKTENHYIYSPRH